VNVLKITDVEIFATKIDLGKLGWHPVIIRINTDAGIYGAGEIGLAYGVGAAAGVGMLRNLAENFLIGADPSRIEHLWDTMCTKTFWAQGGGPVVFGGMSAIDEALWDIKGKALGLPVYELLGGRCWDKLRLYANGWYGGLVTPDEFAEKAKSIVADGYTALKFDPFGALTEGVWSFPKRALERERADMAFERVKAVREAVGPNVDVLVEVHGNLGTTSAIQIGKRLEELDPFFYEEPVDALNVEAMKKVAQNVNIPIAAGERLYTRYGFRPYIEDQVLDIIQPDLGLAGGITEAKKIASYAETYSIHVQPHNCGSPIGTAAAIQLDTCIPNFIIQEWFPYMPKAHYELVKKDLEHQAVNSYLEVPRTSGLGIELNDEALSQYECVHVS
jgi:galactonate dehydratase